MSKPRVNKLKSQPEQPPKVSYRLNLYKYEIIGLLIITVIVFVALTGLFGKSSKKVVSTGESLEVTVEYPTRVRYKTISDVVIELKNISDNSTSTKVYLDREYLTKFSNIKFTPSPTEISGDHYVFDIGMIDAGKTKYVLGEVQSEEYGLHEGSLKVSTDVQDQLSINLKTINLP